MRFTALYTFPPLYTQKPAARRVFVFYRKTGCGALPFLRAISWRLKRADRGPSAASLPRPPDARSAALPAARRVFVFYRVMALLWPSQSQLRSDRPLALSRFLRRATAGACKNRSAAPGCRCPNWRRARGALANLDGCPCSSSAVSAAGSASLTQPLTAPCFCCWQRSLFVPPHAGEPSVPPSNTVNCAVRQSCEQVRLTTA